MLRSLLSVLLGWAAVGILVVSTDGVLNQIFPDDYVHGKMPPDHLAAVSLAASCIWTIAGGWITARLAPRRPWHHLLGLMIWGELLGIASAIATWGQIQPWYQIGLLVMWTPMVIIGGWIRAGRPVFDARPVAST